MITNQESTPTDNHLESTPKHEVFNSSLTQVIKEFLEGKVEEKALIGVLSASNAKVHVLSEQTRQSIKKVTEDCMKDSHDNPQFVIDSCYSSADGISEWTEKIWSDGILLLQSGEKCTYQTNRDLNREAHASQYEVERNARFQSLLQILFSI